MKKIFHLAAVAVLAIGAASCSKDALNNGDLNGGANANKLAFSFEGINDGVTTYATVAAENFEKAVNDATVYIFEYKADKTGQLLLVQNESFTPASDYLVIVDDATNALMGKQLVAYFTINNGAAFNMHANLTAFTAGSGKTEADFAEIATTAIAGKVARTGFLMTSAITGSANFPNSGEYPTEVKRRVARFDIRNERPSSITSVNKITVRKAMDSGNVFGEATVAAVPTVLATDVVYDLTASEYGADGASALAWVAGTDANGNDIETASSVFYLNPTELLKAAPESGTQIFIEATVGSELKVYEVSLAADIDIQANFRYILTLTDDLRFRITVADWTDADEIITTKPISTTLGLIGDPTGDALNSYVANTVALNAAGGTVTFSLTASSAQGTSWSWDTVPAGVTVLETTSTTATYASPYFTSTYTITVDDLTEAPSFSQKLTITDKANPTNICEISFIYSSEKPDAILEINAITFPDAGFRTYVEGYNIKGMVTQAQLNAMVNITYNNLGVTSVKGLEYFPNLTRIDLIGSGLETLDLSNFTKLQRTNASSSANLHTLIMGSHPDLTRIEAFDTQIKSLDVSSCPILTVLNVSRTPISNINFGDITTLEELVLNGCSSLIGHLDVTQFPNKMRVLGVQGTSYSSIDISNQKGALRAFEISNNTNLHTVYVWDGFNTENVESNFASSYKAENCGQIEFIVK